MFDDLAALLYILIVVCLIAGSAAGWWMTGFAARRPKALKALWRRQCLEYLQTADENDETVNEFDPRTRIVIAVVCAFLTAAGFLFNIDASVSRSVLATILIWALLSLALIDWRDRLLPDEMTLPLLWLGLIASVCGTFVTAEQAILGAAFGYGALWTIASLYGKLRGRTAMGGGDFKLAACAGAFSGPSAFPTILFLACLLTLIGVLIPAAFGRTKSADVAPFGPGLALATMMIVVFGEH